MLKFRSLVLCIVVIIFISSCHESPMNPAERKEDPILLVTINEWENLSKTRIYFGHQSVGNNIVEGIKEVAQTDSRIQLNIVEESSTTAKEGGVFLHSYIGKNGAPESKILSFESNITPENNINIAMMKFCYVDINGKTDVKGLLSQYIEHIARLKEKVPGVRLVHVTVPLTSNHPNWKFTIKKLLGIKDSELEANARRNQYNFMLIREYTGKDPVFDLAGLESTLPDGKRTEFQYGGEAVKYLAPQYTSDGDHLNKLGRQEVSKAFLAFLAKLADTK